MKRLIDYLIDLIHYLIMCALVFAIFLAMTTSHAHAFWDTPTPSDKAANAAQEKMLREAHSAIGLPAIRNFREKRLLKMIYELRDQDGLRTYTHIVAQQTAKPFLLCNSIGYPISDATGFTGPDKVVRDNGTAFGTVTQAEPNGLFTPDTSDGYWVMCLDPKAGKATPTFVTGQVIVTTFPLQ